MVITSPLPPNILTINSAIIWSCSFSDITANPPAVADQPFTCGINYVPLCLWVRHKEKKHNEGEWRPLVPKDFLSKVSLMSPGTPESRYNRAVAARSCRYICSTNRESASAVNLDISQHFYRIIQLNPILSENEYLKKHVMSNGAGLVN